jgi:hypothetical protein
MESRGGMTLKKTSKGCGDIGNRTSTMTDLVEDIVRAENLSMQV